MPANCKFTTEAKMNGYSLDSRIWVIGSALALIVGSVSRPAYGQLDDSCTVTVNGQTVQVNPDGSFAVPNVAAPDAFGTDGPGSPPDFLSDNFLRVTGVCTSGGVPVYVASDCFQITQGNTFQVGELTFTETPPLVIDSIFVAPDSPTLTALGQTTLLPITVTLTDGTVSVLDPSGACITFRTSNPDIVSIDDAGVATAVGSGTALLAVTVESLTAVVAVSVSLGDPLTTVVGFVQLEDGTFVENAEVNLIELGGTGITGPDGSFSIPGVATQKGSISASAEIEVDGEFLFGVTLTSMEPVPGGFTGLGTIVLDKTNLWISDSDGLWLDDSNWLFGAPQADHHVVIDRPGVELTITIAIITPTIASLTNEESLVMTSGTLSLLGTSTINGSLTLAGTLTGPGDLTVSGLMTWTGGTLSGTGKLIADGVLSLEGPNTKTLDGRTIDNSGVALWSGGPFTASNGAVFNNLPGATFDVQFDGTVNQGAGDPLHFSNEGLFTKTGETGTTTLNATFDNTGELDVVTGTVNLTQGGSYTGTFSGTGKTQFSGGTHDLLADSTVTGSVSASGGTTNVSGTYEGVNTLVNGGVLNFNVGSTTETLTVSIGGTLTGSADLTVSGLTTWTGGTLTGTGKLIADGGMSLEGTNNKTLDGRTIDNSGVALWSAGTINASNGAVFNNLPGATFDVQFDGPLNHTPSEGDPLHFANEGLFTKTGETGTTTLHATFDNSGELEVVTGTVDLTVGGSHAGTFSGIGTTKFGGGTHDLLAGSTATCSMLVTAGTLSVLGTSTMNGSLTVANGTLTGPGDLTVSGLTTWTGGTLSGTGKLIADGGMSLEGTNNKTLDGRTIDNSGVALWSGGTINASNGAVFNNLPGATLDAQFDGTLNHTLQEGDPLHFANEGLFTKSGETGTTTLNASFDNSGELEVVTGTVNLTLGGSHTGTFSGTGTTQFGGGTHDLLADSTVIGSVSASGGTTNVSGIYEGVNTLVNGGVLDFNVGSTTETLTVSIGGTLTGSADLTVSGLTTWTGGTLTGTGKLIADGGMSLEGTNSKTLDGRTIDNSGVALWSGGNINASNGAVFNNLPGATFDVQFDGPLNHTPSEGDPLHFANQGLFTKTAGTGTTNLTATCDNSGTLAAQSGVLSFNRGLLQTAGGTQLDGGSISISSGFVFDLDGGDLTGAGSLTGTLESDAVVSPGFSAGTLSISNDYTQGTFGELNIEIGGLLAGDEFDVLSVVDQADLAGTLNITLIDDFSPELGDTFQIMTYASHTGEFDTVTGLDLGGGLVFELTFGATEVTLTVATAP